MRKISARWGVNKLSKGLIRIKIDNFIFYLDRFYILKKKERIAKKCKFLRFLGKAKGSITIF